MRILITGASTGIGAALASTLQARGHEVIGLSRSRPRSAVSWTHHTCDVSQWPQVEALARDLETELPSLDGLICAAALQGPIGPALETDPEAWSQVVQVNLTGTFHAMWDPLESTCRHASLSIL